MLISCFIYLPLHLPPVSKCHNALYIKAIKTQVKTNQNADTKTTARYKEGKQGENNIFKLFLYISWLRKLRQICLWVCKKQFSWSSPKPSTSTQECCSSFLASFLFLLVFCVVFSFISTATLSSLLSFMFFIIAFSARKPNWYPLASL